MEVSEEKALKERKIDAPCIVYECFIVAQKFPEEAKSLVIHLGLLLL